MAPSLPLSTAWACGGAASHLTPQHCCSTVEGARWWASVAHSQPHSRAHSQPQPQPARSHDSPLPVLHRPFLLPTRQLHPRTVLGTRQVLDSAAPPDSCCRLHGIQGCRSKIADNKHGLLLLLLQTNLEPDWMAQRLTHALLDWLDMHLQHHGSAAATA